MPKVAGNVVEEGGRWMPVLPRAWLGDVEILPLVDDEWQPVQDKWVLPGRRISTTEQLRALAGARGVNLVIHIGAIA